MMVVLVTVVGISDDGSVSDDGDGSGGWYR